MDILNHESVSHVNDDLGYERTFFHHHCFFLTFVRFDNHPLDPAGGSPHNAHYRTIIVRVLSYIH